MKKKLLLNIEPEESRAVILEEGKIINLEIETALHARLKGNVYAGWVANVEKSIEAAFVDIGEAREGFLSFNDFWVQRDENGLDDEDEAPDRESDGDSVEQPTDDPGSRRGRGRGGVPQRRRLTLKKGDKIMVQVTKDETGKKCPTLTMHISLPGRFLVLVPNSGLRGVSRKLNDGERKRLKGLLEKLDVPAGLGVIIRTSGETAKLNDLKADLNNLVRIWRGVEKRFNLAVKPGVIYKEASLAKRFARDYLSDDVTEILVDSRDAYNELISFVKNAMPSKQNIVKFYDEEMPLFSRYGVERQIEEVFQPRVNLPSGGSIIISPTEALIAIDVNSGRMKEGSVEETAFQTNLEAAREIARQVIIRDLGGLIVVDFIDLESPEHKKAVEAALRSAFREDKAKLSFSRIRDFGIMIFTRQRLKPEIQHGFNIKCEHCGGSGYTKSVESSGLACLRKVRERLCQSRSERVNIYLPVEVTNFLNNARREEITKLEKRYKCRINLIAVEHMMQKDIRIDFSNKNDGTVEIEAKSFDPPLEEPSDEWEIEAKVKKRGVLSDFIRKIFE